MNTWEPLLRRDRELGSFLTKHGEGLLWLGTDGVVRWVNAPLRDLLGYQESECAGHPLADFVVDDTQLAQLLTGLAAGHPVRSEVVSFRARDGSPRPVLLSASG